MSGIKKLIVAAICLLLAAAVAVPLTLALVPRKIEFSSLASPLSVTLLSGEADGSTRIDHAEFGSSSAEAETICAFLREQEYRCGFAPREWGGRMLQLLFVDDCGKSVALTVDEQGKISFNGKLGVLTEGGAAAEELLAAILPHMGLKAEAERKKSAFARCGNSRMKPIRAKARVDSMNCQTKCNT